MVFKYQLRCHGYPRGTVVGLELHLLLAIRSVLLVHLVLNLAHLLGLLDTELLSFLVPAPLIDLSL